MLDNHFKKEEFKKSVKENVKMLYRKTIEEASQEQIFQAVSLAVKDVIIDNWLLTQKQYEKDDPKIVYYLSMEFLMGRALGNNLINLCAYNEVKEALEELGFDLNVIEDQEPDPALGNGGLGRLAACFLDSLATLGYCAYGCGIRYHYGLFKQKIENGFQVEVPDNWLKDGYPFELRRPEYAKEVKFGGYVKVEYDPATGRNNFVQEGYQSVLAIPYDMPIVGYNNKIVNTLRIWDAQAISEFQLDLFDKGDYRKAVEQENLAKNICDVLYPNDNHYAGKELRLKQQYFFISASIQAAIEKFKKSHSDLHDLPKKVTFQLNDTHPTMTVAELMRILLDEEGMTWEEAWEITTHTCAYTNHTIMAEALEKWPVALMKENLPRMYQIIEELDRRFVNELTICYPENPELIQRTRIIQNGQVHMAHLAIICSHSTNGVAKLHSDLLKEVVLHDFYQLFPERFNNKTNGIAQRRWLQLANPKLSKVLDQTIGTTWRKTPGDLKLLQNYVEDQTVLDQLAEAKKSNKQRLAAYIEETTGTTVSPEAIFDVQIKRLHAYKRQLLNLLHILKLYFDLKDDPKKVQESRLFIFGAKAAPSYTYAKSIIKAINEVANLINNDPDINGRIKVVFLENYNVHLAELIIPAADVSEQISLASKEASGTSNMKLMLNGAITLATLDGANVEIRDAVGDDNVVIFGMTEREVYQYYERQDYVAKDYYDQSPVLQRILNAFVDGTIPNIYFEGREIFDSLLKHNDEYFVLRDFDAYVKAQEKIDGLYRDQYHWQQMSLMNIANAGRFSADDTVMRYAEEIWHIEPVEQYSKKKG